MTTTVDVSVCTYRRPQVVDTLASLAAQQLPTGCTLRVIVADNDETPSARELVTSTAADLGLDLTYVHAPSHNISRARNACLGAARAEWFACIDDDQLAVPGWIAAFLAEADRGGWDAVLGQVKAIYREEAPAWIKACDLHSTVPAAVGGRILKGYAGNSIVRLAAVTSRGLTFDEALGRQGGEDDAFYYQLTDQRGTIGYAPEAIVHEPVPQGRDSLDYLLKRNFRRGQSHGARLAEQHRGPALLAQMGLAAGKSGACLAGAAATAWSPAARMRWLVRGALHAGAVARLAGVRELELY